MKAFFSYTAATLVLSVTACNGGQSTSTTTSTTSGGTTTGGACVTMGADCSDAGCCAGSSCVSGLCTCAAHEGDSCDDQDVCCSGLGCDGTGHCQMACAGDAGACRAIGDVCQSDSDCCSPLSCASGACQGTLPADACATDGTVCQLDTDCCGSTDAGSRYACVGIADGGRICHFGAPGEACNTEAPCAPGSTCIIATGTGATGTGTGGTSTGGTSDTGTSGATTGGDGTSSTGGSGGTAGDDPSGACGVATTPITCTLKSGSCKVWDLCDPQSATNQGYDPCFYEVIGQQLSARTKILTCHGGHCNYPIQGEPCASQCTQTAGDPLATQCITFLDGTTRCLESCGSDAQCTGTSVIDSQNNNPPAITDYCVNYGGTASACQPELCYIEGTAGSDDPSVFYQPCQGRPNTLCLPQYFGGASAVLGFCQVVTTTSNSTVGTSCSPAAGTESQAGLCGSDSICLGGICQQICDASQLGGAGTPTCPSTETCISAQGVNLIAAYQVGGCGTPCDPFADEEHSGCTNFCGGPPSKCNWIISDLVPGQIHGYCGAADVNPAPTGSPCGAGLIQPCGPGDFCLRNSTGTGASCNKLCDPTVATGDPDACPSGQTCNAFTGFTHAGYCS